MSKLYHFYKESRNGIIVTLLFHIVAFIILNISQFRIKQEFIETEILIEFPFEPIIEPEVKEFQETNQQPSPTIRSTNIASNRLSQSDNKQLDENLLQELERAQELVNRVSEQLSKEVPTIKDLKMPEEITEGLDTDSLLKKLYSGDSNIEYFLENRFHTRLPIPVYLSQYGGQVKVNITVDQRGNVVSAEPIISPNLPEQILSYAKTAALRTKFNASSTAPTRQSGYISYRFIAQ
jgi:hypothetical protein